MCHTVWERGLRWHRLLYKLVPTSVGQSSAGLRSHSVNDVYVLSTSWVLAPDPGSVFTIPCRGASTAGSLVLAERRAQKE